MKKPSVRKSRPRGEWWWWWGGSWAFLPIITPSRELSPTMRASAGNKECFNSGPPPPQILRQGENAAAFGRAFFATGLIPGNSCSQAKRVALVAFAILCVSSTSHEIIGHLDGIT